MTLRKSDDASPSEPKVEPRPNWRRRFFLLLGFWGLWTFLTAFNEVRGTLAYPLYLHHPDASGDAAYVMADGPASFERLRAASDLYHMKRVPRIILLNEQESLGYDFVERRSPTRVERGIDYLELHGVPREKVSTVSVDGSPAFGSISEADAVAAQEKDLSSVVVVTSAPHTRRSHLAFRRRLDDQIQVEVYAASTPFSSSEVHAPIWVEYAKMLVYYFVA